jgi:hypothetical protein
MLALFAGEAPPSCVASSGSAPVRVLPSFIAKNASGWSLSFPIHYAVLTAVLAGVLPGGPPAAPVNLACPPGSIPSGTRSAVPEGTVFAPHVYAWGPRQLSADGGAAKDTGVVSKGGGANGAKGGGANGAKGGAGRGAGRGGPAQGKKR